MTLYNKARVWVVLPSVEYPFKSCLKNTWEGLIKVWGDSKPTSLIDYQSTVISPVNMFLPRHMCVVLSCDL